MTRPWSQEAAFACGIDWLSREIAPAGGLGRAARKRERPFAPGDESAARERLARVGALAERAGADRLAHLRMAIASIPDPSAILVRARGGDVLADVDFFELGRFLDGLATVHAETRDVALDDIAPQLPGDALLRALAPGRPGHGFYVADAFDARLANARGDGAAKRAAFDAARSRLAARVRAAGIADREGGEFVVMRDAARDPLPPELRVVREAPTYVVCELALDATARDALAALEEADAAVARAEEDVREMLSAETSRAAPELERACAALGDLDSLVARASFCARFACVVPDIDDRAIELIDARFPPLAEALAERNRPYVPISLALGGVAVVTGANMGGKTAALRTLGFAAACVALGVPVPAARARIPLFDEIVWLGVGAEAASGEESALLSAFGAELVALRNFLGGAAGRALVLIDEFARTTAPREGRALLVALLETLRSRGDVALAATHLPAVASAAGVDHFTIGRVRSLPRVTEPLALAAALERIASAMDFALVRADDGRATASDAIELADALGLDAAFVTRAEVVLRTSPE